jgi:hypothetical protein
MPNAPRALGDVGTLTDKVFGRGSSLANLGIAFATIDGAAPNELSYSSHAKISAAAGAGVGDANAVSVSFESEGAFVFQAAQTTTSEIDNEFELGTELVRLWLDHKWHEDWCVVTKIVKVTNLTVLISQSKDASVVLKAGGALLSGALGLANASGSLTIASSSGELTSIISDKPTVPLFTLSKLRRSFIARIFEHNPKFAIARSPMPGLADVAPFETVTPEITR